MRKINTIFILLCSLNSILIGAENFENQVEVNNLLTIQEKSKGAIKQEYPIWKVDVLHVNKNNQIHIIFNENYMDIMNVQGIEEIEIKTNKTRKGKELGVWKIDEKSLKKSQIVSHFFYLYNLNELDVDEGDIIKITLNLFKDKDKEPQKKWTKEIKIIIDNFGFKTTAYDTLAFVRNSFSRAWKPSPGASVTLGYRIFTTRKSRQFSRIFASFWNNLDPQFGINLTLLDYDLDKNIEYGIGWVLSFFHGSIYIGKGWNISTPRIKNSYAFFGISLTNIAEKIKGQISSK